MNYFDLHSYPDHTIAAAWDSQVKEAAQAPGLADILLLRDSELFRRFAACYAELRALPRGVRRALQRRIARSSELAAILPESLQRGGRRLQHRMAWSLAGAALLLVLGQAAATAATITVTTTNPNITADGQCSLIEAIVNANNDAATHADCAAGSGPDTIVLPANANVTLTNANATPYGDPIGLPFITSRITIEGNGAMISRQENAPAFRLMAVSAFGDLTLQNVTLSGGSSPYRGGVNHGFGGGALNDGSLTIESSTISGNTAEFGGGVSNFGTLTIQNSTITQNTVSSGVFGGGGGVLNAFGGVATIQDSTISNNSAPYHTGGGVYNRGALSIENSTVSGNSAASGAGVSNISLSYNLISATITNSTISGNTASYAGGGVSNSSFYGNYATVTLNRSLIAGNQAADAPELGNSSIVNADNFNLFGANGNAGVTGFTPGLTDIVPAPGVHVANILGPLKDNGGPTRTRALKPGSPALDAVPLLDPGCSGTDQRGTARPQGAGCDIGAFEGSAPGSIPVSDFDGDGETDVAVYRDGVWFIIRSTDGGITTVGWGGAAEAPMPADYDGDGKTDVAVYRDGAWYIIRSTDGVITTVGWGGAAEDIPVPADYDGDGKTDVAVYRDGAWYIIRSTDGGITTVGWGGAVEDIPVPADYDGDGKTDVAVYRDGAWYIIRSSDGGTTTVGWGGAAQDIPVPADYDGDGKTDVAVYRDGAWYIIRSSDSGIIALGWGGAAEDVPVPADYDGDGKTDVAVYRDGAWYITRSSDSGVTTVGWGGAPQDTPLN